VQYFLRHFPQITENKMKKYFLSSKSAY